MLASGRWLLLGISLLLMVTVAIGAGSSSPSSPASLKPPKVKVDTVEDTLYGHKIADPYRWLENG